MKRLWPFVIVAAVAAAIVGSWLLVRKPEQAASQQAAVDPLTEAVTLAIKGISLLQGEKGVEFWRLKADWAGMQQQNGEIDVQLPRVRYTLGQGDKPDYLFAESALGRITDQQRVLTMWEDVKVTRGADRVTGPRLVYTAGDRVMNFPDGADVDSQSMFGTFGDLTWKMDTNLIEGAKGVDLTFKAQTPPQPSSLPSPPSPDTNAAPTKKPSDADRTLADTGAAATSAVNVAPISPVLSVSPAAPEKKTATAKARKKKAAVSSATRTDSRKKTVKQTNAASDQTKTKTTRSVKTSSTAGKKSTQAVKSDTKRTSKKRDTARQPKSTGNKQTTVRTRSGTTTKEQ